MTVPIFVTALGAHVPDGICTVQDAIAAGRYDTQRAKTDGFASVRVEDCLSPPDMALLAAQATVN